jgi:polygalacturonase
MKKVLYEALSFKSTCGRGGVIRNIEISDVTVEHAGNHLVCMDNNYQKERHGDAITLFKNITIKNLTCRYAKNAFRLLGKEELPFENINLQNVAIEKADTLYSADENASDVRFENVTVNGTKLQRNK